MRDSTPARLVIVEGVCGAGKTSLLEALARSTGEAGLRVMWQRATYGPLVPLEDAGVVTEQLNCQLLDRLCGELEAALQVSRCVCVDTLYLTHFARVGVLSLASLRAYEERLAMLGARTVFVRALPKTIRERTVRGRAGTGFARYAEKFGEDEEALVAYFAQEQERMLAVLAESSAMPVTLLDAEAPRAELVLTVAQLCGLDAD